MYPLLITLNSRILISLATKFIKTAPLFNRSGKESPLQNCCVGRHLNVILQMTLTAYPTNEETNENVIISVFLSH